MDFDKVIQLIVSSGNSAWRTWLERIKEYSFDSQRLLICLGIDIKNSLIDPIILNNVLNEVTTNHLKYDNPIEAFDIASKKIDHVDCLNCYDENFALSRYANIMRWTNYFTWILPQLAIFDYTDLTFDDYVNDSYHALDIWAEINNATVTLDGKNGLVWVAPYKEIDDIKIKASNFFSASSLCSKYGLPVTADPDNYLVLYYPKGFNVLCKQPTSLNADWTWFEGLFLSFKKFDSFGRTYCLKFTEEEKEGKERVHRKIGIKFADMERDYLGKPTIVNKKLPEVLKTGYLRIEF